MQKFLNVKNIIALVLIGIGLTMQLGPLLPNISPKPDVAILNIDKPDPTDRAKMAIYSQEFATRVKNYDAQLQQVNDVLSLSAKEFFNGAMSDKYSGLDDKIINLITSACGGDDNHKLTEVEKVELSEVFMGLAWALIQRK